MRAPATGSSACCCATRVASTCSATGKEALTLGRAEENDIVVKGNLISRIHARVEFGRSKVMLVDQSTNGSFVTTQDGKEAFVRRDSVALTGSGLIGLGRLPEQNSPEAIRYRLEE